MVGVLGSITDNIIYKFFLFVPAWLGYDIRGAAVACKKVKTDLERQYRKELPFEASFPSSMCNQTNLPDRPFSTSAKDVF